MAFVLLRLRSLRWPFARRHPAYTPAALIFLRLLAAAAAEAMNRGDLSLFSAHRKTFLAEHRGRLLSPDTVTYILFIGPNEWRKMATPFLVSVGWCTRHWNFAWLGSLARLTARYQVVLVRNIWGWWSMYGIINCRKCRENGNFSTSQINKNVVFFCENAEIFDKTTNSSRYR